MARLDRDYPKTASRVQGRGALLRSLRLLLIRTHRYLEGRARTDEERAWAEQRLKAPDLTVQEARAIGAQAELLRRYFKKISAGLKEQNQAALIKILAEWRGGQLLQKVERQQGRRDGAEGLLSILDRSEIPFVTAHRWQILETPR